MPNFSMYFYQFIDPFVTQPDELRMILRNFKEIINQNVKNGKSWFLSQIIKK